MRVGCEASRTWWAGGCLHVSCLCDAGPWSGPVLLSRAKSAVMAATVRKEEATVLVLRVTHVYFQDLHPGDRRGTWKQNPQVRTHHLSPPGFILKFLPLSGLYTAFSMSFWLQQLLLLETEKRYFSSARSIRRNVKVWYFCWVSFYVFVSWTVSFCLFHLQF